MPYGTTTHGGGTYGGATPQSTQSPVSLGSRSFSVAREPDQLQSEGVAGGYGGTAYGGAPYASGTNEETPVPTLTVNALGTAPVALPSRSLTATRTQLVAVGIGTVSLSIPERTLDLSRDSPTVTGIGTVGTTLPPRTLTLTRPGIRVGYADWILDGEPIVRVVDETATDETITLTLRATSQLVETELRPLKSDQGKVDTLATDDGGFVAVDRADGENTFRLIPPVNRLPIRRESDVHVLRYEEDLVGPDLGEWDVELEFLKDAPRLDSPSISQTPTADGWGLTTPLGTIATERVDAEVLGTGDEGVRRFELTTRLTQQQGQAFEAAYKRLRGGRVRNIPDGPNLAVDAVGGDVTLTVDAPDGQDAVPDGDYVVREWDSTRLTDRYQSVSVVIAEKA